MLSPSPITASRSLARVRALRLASLAPELRRASAANTNGLAVAPRIAR